MDRRAFIGTFVGGLLAAPLAAEAQPAGKVARLGYLSYGTATTNAGLRKAFVDGLRDTDGPKTRISRSSTGGREREARSISSRLNWGACR
jgi:hypothetical protein